MTSATTDVTLHLTSRLAAKVETEASKAGLSSTAFIAVLVQRELGDDHDRLEALECILSGGSFADLALNHWPRNEF